jgi:hybrid cluster-associated redox disulfide protein
MLIDASARVDAVLRQAPQAAHVFITYHTDCIGCSLANFCTLEEVSQHYRLDLQRLIADLQASDQPIERTRKNP